MSEQLSLLPEPAKPSRVMCSVDTSGDADRIEPCKRLASAFDRGARGLRLDIIESLHSAEERQVLRIDLFGSDALVASYCPFCGARIVTNYRGVASITTPGATPSSEA